MLVVALEETARLMIMGWIVRGVQVQYDPSRWPLVSIQEANCRWGKSKSSRSFMYLENRRVLFCEQAGQK